jgi:hypothetical protein
VIVRQCGGSCLKNPGSYAAVIFRANEMIEELSGSRSEPAFRHVNVVKMITDQ